MAGENLLRTAGLKNRLFINSKRACKKAPRPRMTLLVGYRHRRIFYLLLDAVHFSGNAGNEMGGRSRWKMHGPERITMCLDAVAVGPAFARDYPARQASRAAHTGGLCAYLPAAQLCHPVPRYSLDQEGRQRNAAQNALHTVVRSTSGILTMLSGYARGRAAWPVSD